MLDSVLARENSRLIEPGEGVGSIDLYPGRTGLSSLVPMPTTDLLDKLIRDVLFGRSPKADGTYVEPYWTLAEPKFVLEFQGIGRVQASVSDSDIMFDLREVPEWIGRVAFAFGVCDGKAGPPIKWFYTPHPPKVIEASDTFFHLVPGQ